MPLLPNLVMYMLKLPCNMFIDVNICCWMYMVHCRIELDEFWVKIAKSAHIPEDTRY
jgi:hypothetical protein